MFDCSDKVALNLQPRENFLVHTNTTRPSIPSWFTNFVMLPTDMKSWVSRNCEAQISTNVRIAHMSIKAITDEMLRVKPNVI